MKERIAYIDDNHVNLFCLKTIFSEEFPFDTFLEPEKFITRFNKTSYVSILVDIHMPGMSGFALYEKIVEHPNYNGCPIIFISTDTSHFAKIKSFELGAVDFLPRTLSPVEMIARVKAKIKYYQKHRNIIEFESLKVNLTLLKVSYQGLDIPVTFIELKLLCLALRNYPHVVTKEEVVEYIWKAGSSADHNVYTHLSNLNVKLKDWDHELISIKSKGIQLHKKEPLQ